MRLRARLILFIAVASLLPVGLLGLGAVRIATARLDARVIALQARNADGLAIFTETWMRARAALLQQQVRAFPVSTLGLEARTGFLRLVYRQLPEAEVVALLDADGGVVGAPVFLDAGAAEGADPALRGRARVDGARLDGARQAFQSVVEESTGSQESADATEILSGVFVGAPRRPAGSAAPVVAVAVALPGESAGWLGVELALAPLASRLERPDGAEAQVALLDSAGRHVLGDTGVLIDPTVFRPFAGGTGAEGIRYTRPDGTGVLAALSVVPGVRWSVVIAEPASISAAAVRDIRQRTAFVALVAAALSLVLGAYFARQLSGPVIALKDAALAVADGALGREVEEDGADELAELSRAFNLMSRGLARNADEIASQRAEIERFNAELQQRVEERTRELQEAQGRLVQSARLAAVGEMGAGLAHELNNPVAGILGLTQLLQRRRAGEPDEAMLRTIEAQALRCKTIVGRLRELTSDPSGPDAPTSEFGTLQLTELMAQVQELVAGPLRQRGVRLELSTVPGVTAQGERGPLEQALAQLILGIRSAAPKGGELRVRALPDGDRVRLEFTLVAQIIDVGGDDWRASSVGLWAARHALRSQGAQLEEPDAPSGARRATWTVRLQA